MREIKFRCWNKEMNKMFPFEDNLVYGTSNRPSLVIHLNNPNEVWLEYTGLKDKNGKEIYEGDIVNIGKPLIGSVVWDCEEAGFRIDLQGMKTYIPIYKDTVEVIGNIYENSELLK